MKPKRQRPEWQNRLAYYFDSYMSKGPTAQFVMLFVFMALVVVIAGILGTVCNVSLSAGSGIWMSLMHLIDPGTLTADEISNRDYLVLMGIVTVIGMVLTGMLISIINNALEHKLGDLRKGHSRIIEKDHTVIIGFDDNVYCILEELIESNKNRAGRCVVVLDETDKETMEQAIHDHLQHIRYQKGEHRTKIICRSGKTIQSSLFERASLETARAVIINKDNDFYVLRTLLAVTNYFRQKGIPKAKAPTVTTLLHEYRSMEAAGAAGQDYRVTNIYFERMLARIMAQVCRQPGLSGVLTELFSYQNSEFHFEPIQSGGLHKNLVGRHFPEVLNAFPNSAIVGIRRRSGDHKDTILLNPGESERLRDGDDLIHLARDDGRIPDAEIPSTRLSEAEIENLAAAESHEKPCRVECHLLVLGCNNALPGVLKNLSDFVEEGSSVLVVAEKPCDITALKGCTRFARVDFRLVCGSDFTDPEDERGGADLYSGRVLKQLLEEHEAELGCALTNILLVCEDGIPPETADAQTAMMLLNLRRVIAGRKKEVVITTEMNLADDQKLLNDQTRRKIARVSDFVVGSDLTNRIMAQVSNDPALHALFCELLTKKGSEIYMCPITRHLKRECLSRKFTFRQLVEIAYHNNRDIVIGWQRQDMEPVLNPVEKETGVQFSPKDKLIVIARG